MYGFLEYLDSVLGRLFDHLTESGLANSTYVMMTGDNGAAMFEPETRGRAREVCVRACIWGHALGLVWQWIAVLPALA